MSLWQDARFGVRTLWKDRTALTLAIVAGIALVLVAIDVYSVVSYTVSQQNREIGIRMALGASRSNVRNLVISGGMQFIAIGIATGLVAAVSILRLAKSLIWGVTTYDPITLLAVVSLLAGIGLMACYLPSRRAIRVDPLVSLRDE